MSEDNFREERRAKRKQKQSSYEPEFKHGKIVKDRSKKYLKQQLYNY